MSGGPLTRHRGTLALAALVLAAGCSQARPVRPGPDRADLHASVAQLRVDEGDRTLLAGVTNDSRRTLHVTAATLRWGGLSFPVRRLPGDAVPPGQTAAFKISYAAAGCSDRVRDRPGLVADIDGRRTTLPLAQDDPTLFARLHAATCAGKRLDDVAAVRLVTARSLRPVGDGLVLPAWVVLTRRAGSTAPLSLVDLDGSVLLRLTPRRTLPVALRTGQREVRVPVTFASAGRCDAHSLGQSQQTFLLSTYLRVSADDVQRRLLPLDRRQVAQLQAVIDRSCAPAR